MFWAVWFSGHKLHIVYPSIQHSSLFSLHLKPPARPIPLPSDNSKNPMGFIYTPVPQTPGFILCFFGFKFRHLILNSFETDKSNVEFFFSSLDSLKKNPQSLFELVSY